MVVLKGSMVVLTIYSMKKIIAFILVCAGSLSGLQAQEPQQLPLELSVDKSVSGLQAGFLGIWLHNETRLSDAIALRAEIGFDTGIWGGDFYDDTIFLLAPVLTAEPRWYYNLKRRVKKSKRIDNNSGNFISLKTSYHPDWFVISSQTNVSLISDISVIPTWGIRRHIGAHLTYELGAGIGYRYIFAERAGFGQNDSEVAGNLHLRLGYTF